MQIFKKHSYTLCLIFLFIIILQLQSCSSDSIQQPAPIEDIQKCEGSINISTSNVTESTAKVNWTTNFSYSSYELEFGYKGFDIGQGKRSSHNNKVADLTNLEFNTAFDVYLRGKCNSQYSPWFGPVAFSTLCDQGTFNGNVLLNTQEEVDNFTQQCFSAIKGNLTIDSNFEESGGITDLSEFKNLIEVIGRVNIVNNPHLTELVGLENLKGVSRLTITYNASLKSLTSLRNLKEFIQLPEDGPNVPGIIISSNDSLTSLLGLENIISIPNLGISGRFTDLSGLNNLESVNNLGIDITSNLESLEGLESLQIVNNLFTLTLNPNLISLQGLNSLKMVGEFRIENNNELISLDGIPTDVSIDHLSISRNNSFSSFAGLNLTSINEFLNIIGNGALIDFNGMVIGNGLATAFITINDNRNFISFNGFQGITQIGGLYVKSNESLVSLNGFQELVFSGNQIYFENNQNLNDFCEMQNLIQNGTIQGNWRTDSNGYNPTFEDMQAGLCK